jgi:hypothetical protein
MKLPETRVQQIPDLERFLNKRGDDPVDQLSRELAGAAPGSRAIVGRGADELETVEAATVDPVVELAENAVDAARKLQEEGPNADFTEGEMLGLEAIILLEGRPPILIQNGSFFPPPPEWKILTDFRPGIEQAFRSVGRIEVNGHPRFEWIGTGFLVADDVVMTNRHVAEEFSQRDGGTGWSFKSGIDSRIDYVEELGAVAGSEFNLTEVIGIHDRFDLALFRVETETPAGAKGPSALPVASEAPDRVGRNVFVVGYPAWDGRRNDPQIMQRLFGNIFDVKRLQPGTITGILGQQGIFHHDCSTLGGNSGSCVIDLETNEVVGLHFGGRFREANQAVALWQLTQDPLLEKAGVNFA